MSKVPIRWMLGILTVLVITVPLCMYVTNFSWHDHFIIGDQTGMDDPWVVLDPKTVFARNSLIIAGGELSSFHRNGSTRPQRVIVRDSTGRIVLDVPPDMSGTFSQFNLTPLETKPGDYSVSWYWHGRELAKTSIEIAKFRSQNRP